MSERRRCMRFNANVDVRYEIPQSIIEGTSISKDISANGIQLSSCLKIDEGSRLGLRINLPEERAPIYTTAEVIWAKETQPDDENAYNLGLSFIKMDSLDRSRILDYIYKNWLSDVKALKQ